MFYGVALPFHNTTNRAPRRCTNLNHYSRAHVFRQAEAWNVSTTAWFSVLL